MFKKVIKNISIISIGTLISRFLGFIRDILIAKFFGASDILEAFLVAFRLPNIFRSVFAEGFSEAVAIPQLSEFRQDKEKVFEVGGYLLLIFLLVLSIFVFLGIIFSKYLVMLIAPGYISNLAKFNLAVSFTRITFIYLLFIGLSSVGTSILYSLKKFFIPAINPIFLNITFIPGVLFFTSLFKNYVLVACVVIAGFLEFIFPIGTLFYNGFSFRFDLKSAIRDSTILRMFKLFLPRIWSSIIYHLNVFLDTILASLSLIVGKGVLAGIYYANRLIQFPFALIALSIAPVVVVDLSSYYKEGKLDDFKKLLVFSFQNLIFFILPISLMFIFIPEGIVDVIFKRGEFDILALEVTSKILFFYAFGLFFFCGIKILVTSFYSLKDTLTPAKTATVSLLANALFSIFFMFFLKGGGIALGTTLGAIVNFFLLYRALLKKIGKIDWQDTREQLFKVFFISFILAIISRFFWFKIFYNKYFKIFLILIFYFIFFVIGGFIFKFKQLIYFKRWILERK